MFLRGSRGAREEARRGEAQGQPHAITDSFVVVVFLDYILIFLEIVFGGFCGYEKAPGPPGRKNLYFLIKILIKTLFKF